MLCGLRLDQSPPSKTLTLKILVSGADGFVGRHLVPELARRHDVIPTDRLEGDLRYPQTIRHQLSRWRPDVVVHLAAKVGRLFGEDDLAGTITDNITMTAHIARACGDRGVRLVYASTSEIYGDNGAASCDELEGPFALPHNAYGLTKRQGEEFCRLYAPDGLTILRLSMPYGPGLPAGRGRAAIINMLHQALHRQLITVHRGAERSMCWVGDTVRAIRYAIDRAEGGVFNIGRDDDPRSMLQIAGMACALTTAPLSLIQEVDGPERQTIVKRLSTDRIRSLGWVPLVDLEEGMCRTYDWVASLDADGNPRVEEAVAA